MASTAYARQPKPAAAERRFGSAAPRLSKVMESKKLGIGLAAGCCLALLTYLSLAKLFAIYSPVFDNSSFALSGSSPKDPVKEDGAVNNATVKLGGGVGGDVAGDATDDGEVSQDDPGPIEPGFPVKSGVEEGDIDDDGDAAGGNTAAIACDIGIGDEGFPYARPEVCELRGDIRIRPKTKTMYFVDPVVGHRRRRGRGSDPFDADGELKIRPFARNDSFLRPSVVEVTLKRVRSGGEAPACTMTHSIPAAVFSVAGYTGNFFHDIADVVIPLFVTTSRYSGEVQFLVTNFKPQWVSRFTPVLSKLSNHQVINFDAGFADGAADEVHCFPHAFLGLFRDRDLILRPHPVRNPGNHSMLDFTKFLREVYGLQREAPAVLGAQPGLKPRMLLISRSGTRKLLNQKEFVEMAEEAGFEVVVAETAKTEEVRPFAELVNSCDVLAAVHGAGLTNEVFLPTGGVLVQIVPWGKMDWMATNFYGLPATRMGLRYVEYYVDKNETTLFDKYPPDHLVFTDPQAIHRQGWTSIADIIMTQDVRVNLTRFRPFLLRAIDLLQD